MPPSLVTCWGLRMNGLVDHQAERVLHEHRGVQLARLAPDRVRVGLDGGPAVELVDGAGGDVGPGDAQLLVGRLERAGLEHRERSSRLAHHERGPAVRDLVADRDPGVGEGQVVTGRTADHVEQWRGVAQRLVDGFFCTVEAVDEDQAEVACRVKGPDVASPPRVPGRRSRPLGRGRWTGRRGTRSRWR